MAQSRNTSRLTARSVLASVLLGTDPAWLPTPLLIRTAALFGISEGTTRTALSRMAAAGELTAEGRGYRLSGRLVDRQARQASSRAGEQRDWDGTWELATVDGDEARAPADRMALRDAMSVLRLAELREGMWARPDNLHPERSPGATAVVDRWCTRWRGARPAPAMDVAAMWGLEAWSDAASDLLADMATLLPDLEAGDPAGLADGFVTSAAVLRHLQADPLLPAELLPTHWPGATLRAAYDRYDRAYRAVLRTWFAGA